jgi:protein O-GlcNAc transferase
MSLPDADGIWAKAVEHHLAGRLSEAESLYQELLREQWGEAKVFHMLGMAEFQQGRGSAGLAFVGAAIALDPNVAKYHGHRGLILASMGNLDVAIDAYRAALAIEPASADTLNNLGAALWGRGDFDAAIHAYRDALSLDPTLTQAAVNFGSLLTNRGSHAEAIEVLKKVAEQKPGDAAITESLAIALNNLGAERERNHDADGAVVSLREALLLRPKFAAAWFNLGKAMTALHRLDEAIAAYRNAIANDPDMAEAYNNLGIVLKASGQVEAAIEQYGEALRRNPLQANVFNNLGNAFRSKGKLIEAESAYRKAIAIDGSIAAFWSNLGSVLDAEERPDEALTAFSQAITLSPDFSEAYNNIGNAKKNLGDIDGALAAYGHATDVQPDNQGAHSNRLYTMYFHPEYSAERIAAEHRAWNAQYAAKLAPSYVAARPASSRLRVGYVAPFFRDHCQSFFTIPLLSHHNREEFHITLYSDVPVPDAMTKRLRGYADCWRNICGAADHAVVDLIRSDGIDVLVDLSLHMSDNRLLVLARKPASVQVTWLGYPGTTGLEAIDYRLTDPFLDPPTEDNAAHYSERSYRLPDTFWCYDPLQGSGFRVGGSGNAGEDGCRVNELPAVSNGFITFGCLNNFCKVNEPTLALWAAVLRAVPGSKLRMLAPAAARRRVVDALHRHGVGGTRLDFLDRMPRDRYLASYHRIDIGLDTIPYNGHTTSLDAFWMGIPVITLIGKTPVGRAGWSQLNNLGLQSLAAATREEFVQIAAGLSEDTQQLRRLRASLRDQLASSPLMDAKRFARNVENAYREMWSSPLD